MEPSAEPEDAAVRLSALDVAILLAVSVSPASGTALAPIGKVPGS